MLAGRSLSCGDHLSSSSWLVLGLSAGLLSVWSTLPTTEQVTSVTAPEPPKLSAIQAIKPSELVGKELPSSWWDVFKEFHAGGDVAGN